MLFFLFAASVKSIDMKCEICDTIANIIAQSVAAGMETSQIKEKLQKKCDSFSFASGICNILVETYFNKLIGFIRGGETAKAACRLINACPKKAVSNMRTFPEERPVIKPRRVVRYEY